MKKSVLLLTALILLAVFAVGGTVAYVAVRTPGLENKFTPGKVSCEVVETFTNSSKTSIKVKNTGNTEAFIRVALTGCWCDADGKIVAPWDGTVVTAADWVKSGSYYYCTKATAANNGLTPELLGAAISGSVLPDGVPSGSKLVIDVLAQAVQSAPTDAVTDAWGLNPASLTGR